MAFSNLNYSNLGNYDYSGAFTGVDPYFTLDNLDVLEGFGTDLLGDYELTPYDFSKYEPYDFGTLSTVFGGQEEKQPSFLERFGTAFGDLYNGPMGTAQRAGQQLAGNLRSGAGEAAAVGQALGIRGQMIAAGASLVGEDAQFNRETNAALRAQQLAQTDLARQFNSQNFKRGLAGRLSPMAISRYSNMIYGV